MFCLLLYHPSTTAAYPHKSWPLLRLPRLARRWLHFKKEDIKVNIKLYSAVLPQVKPSVSAKDAKEIYNLWDESRLFYKYIFSRAKVAVSLGSCAFYLITPKP